MMGASYEDLLAVDDIGEKSLKAYKTILVIPLNAKCYRTYKVLDFLLKQ